ncbi:unnamed protein product [Parnassius mnemosyne]|uniref:Ubiquitin-like protease family profile domain-containing protein n=1 Tax=Parnassius mnemosyne TaxID=213953 RepID=A0AAV1M4X8_9NEOP
MKSIVAYVRNLLGWCEDETNRTSFKRDRTDDDFSSDDEIPALKRLKQLNKTNFPESMASNDVWEKDKKQHKNVRYVPIQIESDHPSTSTPNEVPTRIASRIRTVPIKLVGVTENGSTTPRNTRGNTSVRPVIQAVLDNDDDDQVTWIETRPEKPKKVYINLDDDDENDNEQNDDVIFVKKVSTPPPVKPYKYFYTNETESRDEVDDVQYYRLKKIKDRERNVSPRTYSKFKAPVGITKTYKRVPPSVPKWLQGQNTNLSQSKNRFLNVNGNARTTLSEVFNLDEKRNYQELIRRVASSTKPLSFGKPLNIIDLAEDAASFRMTQRAQKKALNEIKLTERGLCDEKENEELREYDPITVASINSSDSEVEIVPSESSTSSSVKIDPINTLKDSFKDRPITSDDWLAKLNSKYKKKKQDTNEKLKDARRESDIISKVNYEQKLAHLEHKLKHELSIPESLIEEVEPSVELPKLTLEQEKLVNRALGPGPAGQLLVEKFNLRIHRRDLQTLSGLNWLNDEVINFYMNLLMQRSEERPDLPKVYATNTFFYPKLMQSGQAGLRRWTRKVDIFAHDLMVVPVHLGVHWCLSLVDFRTRRISYLDSMGSRNQPCLDALLQYLRDEHKDKKGQPFDDKDWTTVNLKDIPQQMNGSDCGMFACTFAEFSCRNAPYTFSQTHMPYLRRKAALEILQGKLLL